MGNGFDGDVGPYGLPGAGVHPPLPRRDLVTRVGGALGRGALVITAPAGYGKTTLVEAALACAPRPSAWVRCTSAERDPGRLVMALIAAIRHAVPGAVEAVAESVVGTDRVVDPLAVLRALEHDLARLTVERPCVVLDDAESLAGAPESCRLVAELLRGAGDGFDVAVLSRRSLGLRLAKSRWEGRVEEIGPADLTFDLTECADFIRLTAGREPTEGEAEELVVSTEGWPLAVAAVLRNREHSRAPGSSAPRKIRTPRQLKAFLQEEVLDPLDPQARAELLASAVPRHLSPATVDALGLSQAFLASMPDGSLYQRVIDGPRGVVAYHPLFRELLLQRLDTELGGRRVAELHRAVAPAIDLDGDTAGAIEHWMAGGAWTDAVRAIADRARQLIVSSPVLVADWLDRLPADMRAMGPVRLIDGHLAWAAGRYADAIDRLRAASETGDLALDPSNEWWCRFLLMDCLNMSGRAEEAYRLVDGFDRPEAQQAGVIATATGLYAAQTLASRGRTEAAEELLSRCHELPAIAVVAPIESVLRAFVDLPAGRLDAALDRALEALAIVEQSDPLLLRFNVMAAIATVLGEQGRRHEALGWWERQRADAEKALMTARAGVVRGLEAEMLAQMGDLREAEARLAAHQPSETWADVPAHLARCLIASGRGSWDATLAAGSAALASAETAPPLYRYWAMIGVAPAVARVGRLDRADELVADARALVSATFPGPDGRFLRSRILALEAWLAAERGHHDEAVAILRRGLAEAGDAAPHLLRVAWEHVEALLGHAVVGEDFEPSCVVGWLWEAFPDGRGLARFLDHPRTELRQASFRAALSSGNRRARVEVVAACADDDPDVADAARRALDSVAADPPPRSFTTLGGFGVRVGGWQVGAQDWGRPVDARLVRFLLVHGHEPVAVDRLLETFWPDLTPARARRSLQVAASRARGVLDHPGTETIIESAADYYRLRLLDRDVVDWREFERAARSVLASRAPDRAELERARSLWGGDPLPDEQYADWTRGWRDQMIGLQTDLLGALVRLNEIEGDPPGGLGAARELVALEPLNEAAHQSLMAALARAGRRGEALRQYLACRQILRTELGLEPAPRTARLHGRILAGLET